VNERIKLLAEQAGITTNLDTEYFEKDINKWVDYYSKKFAELIVEECANLVKNKAMSIADKAELYGDDINEIDTAKATAWQFLVLEQQIKKHFGVEQ